MHFAPPTAGLDLPCVVPNFTAIPAVTANPHTRYNHARANLIMRAILRTRIEKVECLVLIIVSKENVNIPVDWIDDSFKYTLQFPCGTVQVSFM